MAEKHAEPYRRLCLIFKIPGKPLDILSVSALVDDIVLKLLAFLLVHAVANTKGGSVAGGHDGSIVGAS